MRVAALSVLLCGCMRGGFTAPLRPGDGAGDRPAGGQDASRAGDGRQDRAPGSDGRFVEQPPPPASLIFTVQSDEDDGEAMDAGPSWFPQGEPSLGLMMGAWDNGYTWSFFRFALRPAITPGSAVCDARLELNAKSLDAPQTWQAASGALRVFLERSGDPPLLASADERPGGAAGVALCAASARWPASGTLDWTVGARASSENLAPLLLELAAQQGGFDELQAVRFWVRGDFSDADAEVGTFDASDPQYATLPSKNQLRVTLCP